MAKKSIANQPEKRVVKQPTPSQVSGRLATWHRVMEEAGLSYEDLQAPITDPEIRESLVAFWRALASDAQVKPYEGQFVTMYRAGSGGKVVNPPDDEWVADMRALVQAAYGKMTVAVTTTSEGYDGYPGCQLFFFAGDRDGKIDWIPPITTHHKPVGFPQGGVFGLETNYSDLKKLHHALGRALGGMRDRKKK